MVGREKERQIMHNLLQSKEAELLALIGRRRIGKTYLIRETYKAHLQFEITGIQDAHLNQQLQNFSTQLTDYSKSPIPLQTPSSWPDAFTQLKIYLEQLPSSKKTVLFFDELPWLASQRSGFLQAFAHFWNNWASKQPIIIVICGSAASWMIDHVVNHKGGLHNRITKLIKLQQFSLKETEAYLISRAIKLSRYQITQIYMVMGGIPHYLKGIQSGLSAAQNIDNMCFQNHGLLKNEFSNLYAALFKNADNHIHIVTCLAKKWKGLSRQDILKLSQLKDGGTFSKLLEELETSGFITSYLPFENKKKDTLYRLSDAYSLFYLKFIKGKRHTSWMALSQSQAWKSWTGYAFESLCLQHDNELKKALGISGIYSETSSYLKKADDESSGFQIDMLIDRSDQVISVCEMKFYASEFTITKSYAQTLRQKLTGFKEATKTKKQLFLVMVSTYGITDNMHKIDLVSNDISLNDLFISI
ncbi:MAG: ATP-binding protein [Winogradskyella sp.]|uniref:AAA family ATPase n=1 Tax=Winogradskyella sp. TaxID=1883156 RepID=UPI00385CCD4A